MIAAGSHALRAPSGNLVDGLPLVAIGKIPPTKEARKIRKWTIGRRFAVQSMYYA